MKMLDNILWQRGVMAIVNATPDSFYASSRTQSHDAVVERVREAIAEGATIIDIGGYSSRPDADDVSVEEEWSRVEMALRATREVSKDIAISVDTFRAEIVRRAVAQFGEIIVNDITAGEGDIEMLATVAELGVPYIAMHMRGTPQTMQLQTDYDNIITDIIAYFSKKVDELHQLGVNDIILDPGLGFAKSLEQNYNIIKNLTDIAQIKLPLLVGVSRKSMIYKLLNTTPSEALIGTVALNTMALTKGANILRVHDVKECVETVKIFELSK